MSRAATLRVEMPLFILEGDPACAQTDPELFFPQESELWDGRLVSKYLNIAAAKSICQSCPLAVQCLEYALKNQEVGIWGGTTEDQRRYLKRGRGLHTTRKSRTPELW